MLSLLQHLILLPPPPLPYRLVKSGLLPPHLGPRLTRISATGELVGYTASITLNVLRVVAILEREMLLLGELHRRLKVGGAQSPLLLPHARRPLLRCNCWLLPGRQQGRGELVGRSQRRMWEGEGSLVYDWALRAIFQAFDWLPDYGHMHAWGS